jgi:hypothetical protein
MSFAIQAMSRRSEEQIMSAESKQRTHDKDISPELNLSSGRLGTGLLAGVMAVAGLIIGFQLRSGYPFEHNFHDKINSPILALELSGSIEDLNGVLHTENPGQTNPDPSVDKAVASLRTNTYEDFFFIPLYTSFLWAFAVLFAAGPDRRHITQRRTITAVAILVAGFDCAENVGILRALNASGISLSTAQAICWPSRCKWGLFAVALLLTGWILARSSSLLYLLPTRRLLALAYGAGGILMLIGLKKPHVIELATSVFALLTIVNIVGLLGPYVEGKFLRPRSPAYVEDFCARKARKQADVAVYPRTSGA